jgi:hypothetical protein
MGDIHFDFGTKTVLDLLNMYEKGILNLEPGFQRKEVWGPRDRQRLIQSILNKYPLPSIFLYRKQENDGNLVYYVLDGKQRLESILMFTGHIRGKNKAFDVKWVTDDNSEVLNWRILQKEGRHYMLTGYKLPVIEVEADFADVIQIFVNINSTGKHLTRTEIAHAKSYRSTLLRAAKRLCKRYERYFIELGILTQAQILRMKDLELLCELIISAHDGAVIGKKTVLDRVIERDSIQGKQLQESLKLTERSLKRVRRIFPDGLAATRFRKLSDFYTLCVLVQKFEREGLILSDPRRNRQANELLASFATHVDILADALKRGAKIDSDQELYLGYYQTVQAGTDKLNNRQKREELLRKLLEPLFEAKDSQRSFSVEQRRVIWNSAKDPKCSCEGQCGKHSNACGVTLTWDNFTIDHIKPYNRGGQTAMANAELMCRSCNAAKKDHPGRRRSATIA